MEWILAHFTEIFIHFTSFLCVWGIVACHTLFATITRSYQKRKCIRKADIMYFGGLGICTFTLLMLLFVFQDFASTYMIAILVFEVWYFGFVCYFTTQYIYPCITQFDRRREDR